MGKGYGAQDSRQPATAQLTPLGYRPSYDENGVRRNQGPGSAPDYLDFEETETVLGSEDVYYGQFRRTLVDTAMALRNLGLNKSVGDQGADRAAAYLDAVTWDPKTRKSYEKD